MSQIFTHKNYTIVAETYETSQSWGHKATLFINGNSINTTKIRYYNRTWESYQYQSVITNLLADEIHEYQVSAYARYKDKYNIKRLNDTHKQKAIDEFCGENYKTLKEWYDVL